MMDSNPNQPPYVLSFVIVTAMLLTFAAENELLKVDSRDHLRGTTRNQSWNNNYPKATHIMSCSDSHSYCSIWASNGECTESEVHMRETCPWSCGLCDNKKESAVEVNFERDEECVDQHNACHEWAEDGECFNNNEIMVVECCRSCAREISHAVEIEHRTDPSWIPSDGVTHERYEGRTHHMLHVDADNANDECIDRNGKCRELAEAGKCLTELNFLHQECCQTCKDKHNAVSFDSIGTDDHDRQSEHSGKDGCDGLNVNCTKPFDLFPSRISDTEEEEEVLNFARIGCIDVGDDCSERLSECSTNQDAMFESCRKSCGMCSHEDDHEDCELWASVGECLKNPDWMLAVCRKSCNAAHGDDKGKHTSKVDDNVSGDNEQLNEGSDDVCEWCVDRRSQCKSWTSHCDEHPGYMHRVCRKTCGKCECDDHDSRCEDWAAAGECIINAYHMETTCPLSCGTCYKIPDDSVFNDDNYQSCDDDHPYCSQWAADGECYQQPEYMLRVCRKSCDTCSCEDKHEHCAFWASEGECLNSRDWMGAMCQKTCGTCIDFDFSKAKMS